MRFVDVTNDVAFRKIFGNEKKSIILISFLNAILELEGERRITQIQFLNPYQLPRIAGEKASIIDVKAQDATGRRFVIEMQLADVNGFAKRVQYYTSKEYASQIDQGEEYELLKPIYFIGILDFDFFKGTHYLCHHLIMDKVTHEHALKDISFYFIELKKFKLAAEELKTLTEKWIYFIKNVGILEAIPANTEDEGLRAAYEGAERHSWSKKELSDYVDANLAIQDAKNRLVAAENKGRAKGMKEGIEKGRKEGIEKGREEGKYEMIKSCLANDMSLALISRIAQLPIEEIEKIKKNIQSE